MRTEKLTVISVEQSRMEKVMYDIPVFKNKKLILCPGG